MKKIKQIVSFILSFSMTFSTIFMLNTKDTYATSIKYVDNARNGITYSYDLDKDGKKEKILCLIGNDEYGYTLDLYINNKLKASYSDLEDIPCVSIYDINKNDKSLDIYVELVHESMYCDFKILKYNKGAIKSYTLEGGISSFDSNKGIMNVSQSYPTSSYIKKRKYIASKNLTAYKTTTGKTKAFTIKKGYKFNIVALYKKGSSTYIKVKNSSGKYGYVKTQSTMIVKNPIYAS
ncbi:hypothetical protein [Intestinibacter bartlettii]|uniref:hypothetical protein n=1 Tax=Intestinibacter bartlettii TaxID=261299 RepID=UPI00319E0FA2